MCFYDLTGSQDQVIWFLFFVITSLKGGRAQRPETMHIAEVIHLQRSVTPVIFAIFKGGLWVFFQIRNATGRAGQ